GYPGGDAVLHVLGVGVYDDSCSGRLACESVLGLLEGGYHRPELHAVVGGIRLAARAEDLFVRRQAQYVAPAARAGIARAAAVGVDDHVFHRAGVSPIT